MTIRVAHRKDDPKKKHTHSLPHTKTPFRKSRCWYLPSRKWYIIESQQSILRRSFRWEKKERIRMKEIRFGSKSTFDLKSTVSVSKCGIDRSSGLRQLIRCRRHGAHYVWHDVDIPKPSQNHFLTHCVALKAITLNAPNICDAARRRRVQFWDACIWNTMRAQTQRMNMWRECHLRLLYPEASLGVH